MEQLLNITYALRTNPTQHRYVSHEIAKGERMYALLLQQQQRCQKGFHELEAVKGYAKHFLPAMNRREMWYMASCLRRQSLPYQCNGAIDASFRWRGIDLYPLLMIPHAWMRIPIHEHWRIKGSRIYERGGTLYLSLQFDKVRQLVV